MSDISLNQLLSDEEIPQEPTEETTGDKSEEKSEGESKEVAKVEESEEASTGDDEVSTPEPDSTNKHEQGQYAALKAEREKRQQSEQRTAELERKLSELEKKPEAKPDIFDDPEGYQNHIDKKIADAALLSKIEVSQAMLRREKPDYDQREAEFLELAKGDPSLYQKMQASDFPAEFVYQTAVNHERFSQFDSFDDAVKNAVQKEREGLEKTLREQLEKEYEAKLKKATSLPPSGAGGSMGSDSEAITDYSLNDILHGKN